MLVTCWSSKGGSGTTTVAAGLAVLLAGRRGRCTLVDLGGDATVALGLAADPGPGLAGWLGSAADRPLAQLLVDAGPGLAVLPRGRGPLPPTGGRLAAAVAGLPGPVVADAGTLDPEAAEGAGLELARASATSLLVVRPCYLALRRATALPVRPSAVVVVDEDGRSLDESDIQAVLGAPVVTVVPWDPDIARRVDAGLLGAHVPSRLARALRRAA